MNDTVCVLDEEVDFDTFVVDLIHEHERFRGNTVSWTDPTACESIWRSNNIVLQ